MERSRPKKPLPMKLLPRRENLARPMLQHNKNNFIMKCNITVLEPKTVSDKGVKWPQQKVLPPISKDPQETPLGCRRYQRTALPQVQKIQQKTFQKYALQKQEGMQSSNSLPTERSESDERQKIEVMPTVENPAMSPETVLRDSKSHLTAYELEEIKDYTQVWCFGMNTKKTDYSKITKTSDIFNSGYDTKEGYYKAIINDHLAYRFEILKVLGRGLSGQVFKCMDHKTGELVAIKVIRNKSGVHCLGEAEVKILEALREADKDNTANIVHMKENFYFRKHLCIAFELFEKDLCEALKETHNQGFNEGEVRKYAIDVLKCLRLLNEKMIIHSDLKPENVLLSQKDSDKRTAVSDFGASYFVKHRHQPFIHTLNYASPESLLDKRCSQAIDMWSLGCMLAELYLGRRLFRGRDNVEQFTHIMKVLGVPPPKLVVKAPNRNKFFDSDGIPLKMTYLKNCSTTLAKQLKSKDADFVVFLKHCLQYDPVKRITPEEALQHPWIQQEMTNPVATAGRAHTVPTSSKRPALLNREKMPLVQLQPVKKANAKKGGN